MSISISKDNGHAYTFTYLDNKCSTFIVLSLNKALKTKIKVIFINQWEEGRESINYNQLFILNRDWYITYCRHCVKITSAPRNNITVQPLTDFTTVPFKYLSMVLTKV